MLESETKNAEEIEMAATTSEAAKLLSLSMSSSDSSSDTLRISIPRQKVLAKRKRKGRRIKPQPQGVQFHAPALDSLPKIGKFLFSGLLFTVLLMETFLIARLSRRVEKLEAVTVDADGKHVPDTLRDLEQRLNLIRVNQSQVEQLVGQLSSQLDRISQHVELVNGSAEALRLEISDTINKQMPSHSQKFNLSLSELRSQIDQVSNDLGSVNKQLGILNSARMTMQEVLSVHDASITSIEDAISGKDDSSSLAQSFNKTIEALLERMQTNIDSRIQQAQSDIQAKMSSSMKDLIRDMKRELATVKPTDSKAEPVTIASNIDRVKNNNNNNHDDEPKRERLDVNHPNSSKDEGNKNANTSGGSKGVNSNDSDSSATSTKSPEVALKLTTRSPSNALITVT